VLEIEKKYRLFGDYVSKLSFLESLEIERHYYPKLNNGVETRISKWVKNGIAHYSLTAKRWVQDGVREEAERNISRQEFESSSGKGYPCIKKTRYILPYGDFVIEVDEFHYPVQFWMAEVEFPDLESAYGFRLPSVFGEYLEVTDDPNYYGVNLAKLKSLEDPSAH
jgi:CYTH domain-containing protein